MDQEVLNLLNGVGHYMLISENLQRGIKCFDGVKMSASELLESMDYIIISSIGTAGKELLKVLPEFEYEKITNSMDFSYHHDAPLDMRMSQQGPPAADLVNTLDREELTRILRDYGEEPYAWQIAGKIVETRETAPILTTLQLADTVASAMPPAERRKNKNPSRRTFQALRIAVNHELDALEEGLDTIFDHLAPGGRLCVITFHSLEDRLVKNKFRRWSTACTCPPEFPVCVCGGKAKAKLITRKPIEADTQELEENRRSRSAHLRVLEKC